MMFVPPGSLAKKKPSYPWISYWMSWLFGSDLTSAKRLVSLPITLDLIQRFAARISSRLPLSYTTTSWVDKREAWSALLAPTSASTNHSPSPPRHQCRLGGITRALEALPQADVLTLRK
ncbi:hypothetical protein PF002_g6872 [Phytophthora fragariae]|uniref:Uncharacterized protein n=1 Tax=Phytophthora fragariae TaxID=53985 RepID=A0A6A4A096_9STRA|nr:hypothetical protein PF002_g6872 [Phytophthora fragariae]